MSKIIESLRDDLTSLHQAGAISEMKKCEFDAVCLPPVRELGAAGVTRLREKLKYGLGADSKGDKRP